MAQFFQIKIDLNQSLIKKFQLAGTGLLYTICQYPQSHPLEVD
ncbi:hypothetical protein SOHN41_02564 [Shewanella sp. HN-41]|nr:hypothetical protein SOHN41_02564 [Shewanella sp. HN-41]